MDRCIFACFVVSVNVAPRTTAGSSRSRTAQPCKHYLFDRFGPLWERFLDQEKEQTESVRAKFFIPRHSL